MADGKRLQICLLLKDPGPAGRGRLCDRRPHRLIIVPQWRVPQARRIRNGGRGCSRAFFFQCGKDSNCWSIISRHRSFHGQVKEKAGPSAACRR